MNKHSSIFLIILLATIGVSVIFALIIGSREFTKEDPSAQSNASFSVVSTVGMIGDLVSVIAGENARASTIIGTGIDPHLYTPTRGDVAQLHQADIVFYVGLHLEGAMVATLDTLKETRPNTIIAIGEALPADLLIYHEGTAPDPHIWMDVTLWAESTDIVADYLSLFDPIHANEYQLRAQEYKKTLLELDAYIRTITNTIPPKNRSMITAHDAFSYFEQAYDITVYGIQGISTISEASIDRVNELVNLIVEKQIPSIFVETSVPDRYVRALIEGSTAKRHTLTIGGSLFSDAMGQPGTYRGTYIGMLDHNATIITRSLGGNAPKKGFQNLLE